MPKIANLFALMFCGLPAAALAAPQLPQQEVNLAVLDLNGSPFRQFHLQHFAGVVLDPHAVTPASERQTATQELMRKAMNESWKAIPGQLISQMPRQSTQHLEPLLHQRHVSEW